MNASKDGKGEEGLGKGESANEDRKGGKYVKPKGGKGRKDDSVPYTKDGKNGVGKKGHPFDCCYIHGNKWAVSGEYEGGEGGKKGQGEHDGTRKVTINAPLNAECNSVLKYALRN